MKASGLLMLMAILIPKQIHGQDLVGTLSFASEAGYLTNTYLHPVLPLWIETDAPFVGIEPAARLEWIGNRTYAGLEGRLRLIERMNPADLWSLTTVQGRVDRRLVRTVAAGLDGSVSRIRMESNQWLAWGGPYVRARPARPLGVTLRLGTSYRYYDAAVEAEPGEQTTIFGVLQIDLTTSALLDVGAHLYTSRPASGGASATGGGISAVYSVSPQVAMSGEMGTEHFGSNATMWRGAAAAHWIPNESVSWSARFGMQQFAEGNDTAPDVFAGIGFTYRLRQRRDMSPPSPIEWSQRDELVELRYTYEGEGRLYLVGDFNNWSVGSTGLEEVSDGIYAARLALAPGRYEYKIVVVEGGTPRWLPLPDNVLTTDDDFGGTNGILLVEEY